MSGLSICNRSFGVIKPQEGVDVAEIDEGWLRDVIESCTLGEMRERFVRSLLLGNKARKAAADPVDGTDPSDDIELC